jgi:hypothetical protein
MSTFQERKAGFQAWRCAPLGDLIDRGNYGLVHRSGSSVAKVLDLVGKSRNSRRQAFREHVVAMLQSLLLLRAVTPHYPFHYGAKTSFKGPSIQFTFYMEAFQGNLLELAVDVLTAEGSSWTHLVFQTLHACLALSHVFGVVSNDLYPRNLLVRKIHEKRRVDYVVEGARYSLRPSFLVAVTDYGISSGHLLGASAAPEVHASTVKRARPSHFSLEPPRAHILQYEPLLPPYSRDPYTVLKWVFYAQEHFPVAPWPVRAWCLEAMARIDRALESFSEASAQGSLFHHLFHPTNLDRFGLPTVSAALTERSPETFVLDPVRGPEIREEAERALWKLREDERDWAEALRAYRSENINDQHRF